MKKQNGMPVVVLMCLGIFICMLDSTIMNITLPAIQEDLHTTLETSSWMLNVYTMAIAVLAIPMARFADLFGKHKFFMAGLVIFSLGSALCGLSDSGIDLIVFRFVQGIGAACLIPCSMVIGVSAVPLEKRAVPLTLLGATQGLATALGPTIGGIITQNLSWHWVFYVNVPICLVGLIASFYILDLKHETRVKAAIDWIGVLLCGIAIFSLNLVLIKGFGWGWASLRAIVCYGVFALAFVLFLHFERKNKSPMIQLKLFKDRVFVGSIITVLVGFLFIIAIMVLMPQFLTLYQGKSEFQAALLVTPISATVFVFSNAAGLLIKKIGYALPISFGFLLLSIPYFMMRNLNIQSSSGQVIVICVLVGLGFSFLIAGATMASASSFVGEMLTSSQSVFSMIRQIGILLSVAIFVSALNHTIESKKLDVVQYASAHTAQLNISPEGKEQISKTMEQTILLGGKLSKENLEDALDQSAAEPTVKAFAQSDTQNSITAYVSDIASYAKKTVGSSFSVLYTIALPFVLLSMLIGLIFRRPKPRASVSEAKASGN
ncbi:MFS transporter [Paenibacillus sp. Mc5Re-14]|uniref:MFS transporter n=1 Tax=Paenibacillus sp. Mc5Re-14 TaxID=1030529 RepID=UPI000B2E18D0|nr:MFS transporter [Paenibacillus sp. Mc5Re-14]